MSLIQWNLQSFRSNREQVRILFKEHDVAAMCLQETKLGDITPNVGFNLNFYQSPPLRGIRAHGGVGIILKKIY